MIESLEVRSTRKALATKLLFSESASERSQPVKQSLLKNTNQFDWWVFSLSGLDSCLSGWWSKSLLFSWSLAGKHKVIEARYPDFNFIWFSQWTKTRGVDALNMFLGENVSWLKNQKINRHNDVIGFPLGEMRQHFTCPGIIQIALKGLITDFIRILPLLLPCSTRWFCANERLTPNTHNSWLFYHIRMFLPEHSANTRAREKKTLRTAFDSSPVAFFLSEIWSTFHNISGVSCIYPQFPFFTTYYYIRLRSLPSQEQWYPVLSIMSPMEWALAVHSNSLLMNSPYLSGLLLCLSHPSLSALWGHFLLWFRCVVLVS